MPNPAQITSASVVVAPAIDDPMLLAPFTRWLNQSGLAESQFQLSGLHCAACAGIIERALLELPCVSAATVNAASARLQLVWQPGQAALADLLARIEAAGYGAAPDVAAPARQLREREQRLLLWRLFVAAFLMMQTMMMASPSYFAAAGDLKPDLLRLLQWACWVLSLPVLLFSAGPFFRSALQQIKHRQLGMDVPVALGMAVIFLVSSAALFEPDGLFGDQVYFDSLTMFVTFLLAGRYFELRARHRAAAALEKASGTLPDCVERIAPDGSGQMVAPLRLRVGDLVRVCAGQAFPADGRIEAGSSMVDEALLTGESRPVAKSTDDEVVAGSLNLQAPLLMRVLRVGADTRLDAIVRLMQEAMTQRPAISAMADRVARHFLWVVLLLAGAGALLWSWLDPARAVWVGVSVLIVTCPCALSLAAPSAWLAATAAMARRGLLLVRIDMLETLCHVDTVVLDKTGTLTEDRMELLEHWLHCDQAGMPDPADVSALSASLLAAARSLARHSQHPFSRAIASSDSLVVAADWIDVQEIPGKGLQATDPQGRTWRLGAPAWVNQGQPHDAAQILAAQLAFGRPGQLLCLRFGEVLRSDAMAALARMHKLGLRTLLLSGDRLARVELLAAQAGVQQAQGDATPANKLAVVASLQSEGHCVLMVGDGINDAPVLALADASIVMGKGAMLARASADGLLLSNRLMDLVLAIELALRTRRVMKQNLLWAAAYNAACIPLAMAGLLPPWAAGLGMAASSGLVVLNAQRLARPIVEK